jgi:hypothetical protein
LLVIGAALGLATISDGFLYLTLQRRLDFNIGFFPLLYVATALIFMLLAVPAGSLADRIGRGRVFVGGYVLLLVVYALLLLPWQGTGSGGRLPGSARGLLCRDGRGADGTGECSPAGGVAHKWAGLIDDGHEPGSLVQLGPVWPALDMAGARGRRRGVRGWAPDGHTLDLCCSHFGKGPRR